jgi:protein-L-isoaspartate(D-aspartate) O-methyltransferase
MNQLGRRLDISAVLHSKTKRNYVQRVVDFDKAQCAEIAQQWDYDYWDGDRQFGYGGYHYDGRQVALAKELVSLYGLQSGDRVLDIGCGKGYLLYELTRLVPGLEVVGLDISQYAIEHAKSEVHANLIPGNADSLPFQEQSFDLVVSFATLHNLGIAALWKAVHEIERVGRRDKYIMVESYRNESEKANLLYWQLTCHSFFSVEDWEWIYRQCGFTGDYGFIFFE